MRPLDPAKQANIIKAVFTIAGKEGLTGINISAISKEAGIGIGSLYTYFKSKEELIQAAYKEVEHILAQEMYEGFDLSRPVKDTLKTLYTKALNYRLQHYNETIFIDQYIRSAYVQLNFRKQVQQFEEQNKPFYTLLKKGQDEGVMAKLNPFMMISFFNAAVRSCANNMAQKLVPDNKQTVEDCFHMVWKGLSA